MSVYVDDFACAYRRMRMFHMLADTDEELHAMADQIGVSRRWHQNGMSGSHYDISLGMRRKAVAAGAIEITVRQAAMMTKHRRKTGRLGQPDPYFGEGYDPALPYPGDDPRVNASPTNLTNAANAVENIHDNSLKTLNNFSSTDTFEV